MMKKLIKAQAYLEYGVLIAVVVVALIAMRAYFVRSVQEKYRQSADVFGEGEQYESGKTQISEKKGMTGIPETPDSRDPCPSVANQVASLTKDIQSLTGRASSFTANAAQVRQQAQILLGSGVPNSADEASQLTQNAVILEEQAANFAAQAQEKQNQIEQIRKDYADCF